MAHISLSPPKGATTLSPLDKAYERPSKDGLIPVVNFQLGSHYNTRIGGEMSITSTGNIDSDTAKAISGKLEIAARSTDGSEAKKIVTFNSFMYFFPGVVITGQAEIVDAVSGDTQRMRYEFEDLATNDKIIIDFQSAGSNAQLVLREVVDDVETDLSTKELTAAVINIFWELDFLKNGVTELWYKEPSGVRTRAFQGTLNVDIAEAKISAQNILTETTAKTLKSDFLWIFYPNIFIGYNNPVLADGLLGRIRIFDTDGEPLEADWIEVFSGDHKFSGERVVENGLIRIRFKTTPLMQIFGWNITTAAWESIGDVIPIASNGDVGTVLHDVIIQQFNDVQTKIVAKYGIVDHIIDIKRGSPNVRIVANSKKIRVATTARRFALSTDVNTDIPDFNQENTDDANRGNPLNLSPTNDPFVFTDDNDIDTGLDRLDDSWFGWYDENDSNNMVGWLATSKRPTGLEVKATSSTALEKITWTFDINSIIGIGVLESDSTIAVGGIPKPFNIAVIDEYVKWRANESIFGFNSKQFLRKRR